MRHRVVVTGAAGRLGGKVAAALRATGQYAIVGVDRAPEPAGPASWDEFVTCDLAAAADGAGKDHDALRAAMGGAGGVHAVVHCAAWPGPSATPPPAVAATGAGARAADVIGLEDASPPALLRDNVGSTAAVVDAAVWAGAQRVVFSSSAFAMGWSHAGAGEQALRPRYLPLDEAHPPSPLESYGLSKAACELVLEAAARTATATSFVSLRFTNVIKAEKWAELPWAPPTAERPLPLVFWAYAHEDDVVAAHVAAVGRAEAAAPGAHEAYLLAAPETRFGVETRDLLRDTLGLAALEERSPLDGNASVLCSRKARERLLWAPRSWAAEASAAEAAARGGGGGGAAEGEASPSALAALALPRAEVRGGVAALRARADPALRTLDLSGMARERGGHFPEGSFVAYRLYGAPPSEASGRGVILHPTSFDAVHAELEHQIGPGATLDTDRHCVVAVNLLGNGVSLSPSTAACASAGSREALWRVFSGPGGPPTVGDNVRAQAAVLEQLGVRVGGGAGARQLRLVYGYSMGGLQAFEWAVRYPHACRAVAVVCGGARCSALNATFIHSLVAALKADPAWDEALGRFTAMPAAGLRAFARIYAGWGVGEPWYEEGHFERADAYGPTDGGHVDAESFGRSSYVHGFLRSDADDMLAQLGTWLSADVSRNAEGDLRAALGAVRARVLLMPCDTDKYFTLGGAREEAAMLGTRATLAPIRSAAGHRAGDPHRRGLEPEAGFIRARVREILDEVDALDS